MISAADARAMAEDLAKFEHDPWGFVKWAYPWGREGSLKDEKPRTWQKKYLMEMRDRMAGWNKDTVSMIDLKATVAGNGNGKSALLAWLLEWAMYTKPFTRGYVTAGTEDQLLTKTMPEVSKWHHLNIAQDFFILTATAFFSSDPKQKLNYRFDIQAWNKSRPESGAGLHNKGLRVMKLFDESSQIPDAVFEVAEGANTDEKTEIIHHVFGNGTRSNGYFAEATFGNKAERWNPSSIDCRQVEGTNKALYAEWVKEYGEDSDFVRTHVRGLLPKSSALQFIPTKYLERAEAREAHWEMTDPLVMIIDPARGGEDDCVIRFAIGWDMRTFDPIRIPGSEIADTTKLEAKIQDVFNSYKNYGLPRKPDCIIIDAVGIGGPVANHLERMGHKVYQFRGSEASPDPIYANMRAYSWSKARDAMRDYLCLDTDFHIQRDIRNQESTLDAHEKVMMVKKSDMKKIGLPSPNDGDTIAMRCATYIPPIKTGQALWEKTGRGGQKAKPYSLKDKLKRK